MNQAVVMVNSEAVIFICLSFKKKFPSKANEMGIECVLICYIARETPIILVRYSSKLSTLITSIFAFQFYK